MLCLEPGCLWDYKANFRRKTVSGCLEGDQAWLQLIFEHHWQGQKIRKVIKFDQIRSGYFQCDQNRNAIVKWIDFGFQ